MQLFQCKCGSVERHEGRSESLQNRVHQFNSGRGLHSNPLNYQFILVRFCSDNPACYRIATLRVRSVPESCFQGCVDGRNRVLLHPRNDVAAKVQGDPDFAVTQSLAGGLGVDSVGKQVCGVRVAQVMEPEPGQRRLRDQPGPLLRHIDRLDDRAVCMGNCALKQSSLTRPT